MLCLCRPTSQPADQRQMQRLGRLKAGGRDISLSTWLLLPLYLTRVMQLVYLGTYLRDLLTSKP